MLTNLQRLKSEAWVQRSNMNDKTFAQGKDKKLQGRKLQKFIDMGRKQRGSDALYSKHFKKMFGVKPKL